MATRTLAEQATEVLAYLGVIAQGQSASAQDQEKAEGFVTSAYRQLRRRGLAPYPSSAIPEEYWAPLAKYVAAELAPVFGKQRDPMAKDEAEREIRQQVFPSRPTPGFVAKGRYH